VVELECIPYGAGHGDEGLCLLLRLGPYRVMLDCGLQDISSFQQGSSRGRQTKPQPLPADWVLCSHAHPDHARGLVSLHAAFPTLPIYASEVTTHLLPLNWPDLDFSQSPFFCQALPWRSPVELAEGLSVELLPSGHLPGAAAFLLSYTPTEAGSRSYTVLFTGDFFLSNARLVEGLPLDEFRQRHPDVLIVEGTYGTARHPHRRTQENQLAERMIQALEQGWAVMLPVPVLGPGQELLMLLRSHHRFTGKDVDIWVDELIAAGCDAYLEILSHLPTSVQNFAQHQPLFWDQRVRPRVRRLEPEQRPQVGQVPCIVLVEKTLDLNDLVQSQERPWLVLLPQRPTLEGTLGPNAALDPVRALEQRFLPLVQAGRLKIETYLLAQHSDGPGTTQLLHNLRPQHIVFVHGAPTYLADLAGLDELNNRYHLHCPGVGSRVELPIGEGLLQPHSPLSETNYEGELSELGTVVTVTLPEAIAADPRWQTFADTGLIEARWQGDELVLRGLSQRELLVEAGETEFIPADLKCCARCQHDRGNRCWNPDSPLYGFKVTPDGYCPEFEPLG
jgi:Cft2 family RNA processing exonuclease